MSSSKNTAAPIMDLQQRQRENIKLLRKLKGTKVPIYVEKAPGSKLDIERHKYCAPSHMSFLQFQKIIRKKLKGSLQPDQGLFVFVNNVAPSATSTLGDIYREHVLSKVPKNLLEHIYIKEESEDKEAKEGEEDTFGDKPTDVDIENAAEGKLLDTILKGLEGIDTDMMIHVVYSEMQSFGDTF